MTRHMFTMTTPSGETRNVAAGYDRMCGHFFLQVTDPTLPEDDQLVYFSSYDPRFLDRSRTGAAFGGATFEELEMCLAEQQITLPEGLRERLLEDGELERGNDQKYW
ncbi:hypothetical protein ASF71_16340 [Deinococcus sp. Leaf326]|nr:hypothetical protein ASF71_16340 [Deinococcus sp. Leaf326]